MHDDNAAQKRSESIPHCQQHYKSWLAPLDTHSLEPENYAKCEKLCNVICILTSGRQIPWNSKCEEVYMSMQCHISL